MAIATGAFYIGERGELRMAEHECLQRMRAGGEAAADGSRLSRENLTEEQQTRLAECATDPETRRAIEERRATRRATIRARAAASRARAAARAQRDAGRQRRDEFQACLSVNVLQQCECRSQARRFLYYWANGPLAEAAEQIRLGCG